MVGGYVDGPYAWSEADWARFPNAIHVTISVDGNAAQVGDVERGAMTIGQAIAIGYGTVYCSASSWPNNVAAYRTARKPQPNWWIAAYPGAGETIPAGAVAHQYSDVGGFDSSVAANYWPGVDPAPKPEEEEMKFTVFSALTVAEAEGVPAGTEAQFASDGTLSRWLRNPADYLAFVNVIGPQLSGNPVVIWPNGNVASPGGFGAGADQTTKAMLGLAP